MKSGKLPHSATVRTPRRGRKVVVVLATVLILLGGLLALFAYVAGAGAQGFMPPQMAAAYPTPKDVVGDLGGMPVRIERHVVRLVEYDGDPGWGGRRQGPPPERTHTSRLASFGFYVRYPDMRSLDEPEMRADFERYHPSTASTEYELKEKNPWLRGGISSGNRYPRDGFLDREFWGTNRTPVGEGYVPEPSPINGLELFIASGANAHTGEPWRYQAGKNDTYVHRDPQGKVTTIVRCGYESGTQRPTWCEQTWSMEGHGLGILVDVMYRHGLLPQWKDIQAKVSQFILNFKDTQAADAAVPEAAPAR